MPGQHIASQPIDSQVAPSFTLVLVNLAVYNFSFFFFTIFSHLLGQCPAEPVACTSVLVTHPSAHAGIGPINLFYFSQVPSSVINPASHGLCLAIQLL